MRTSEKASSQHGTKRTFGECVAVVGAKMLRLLLEGISARAHAITGTQPHKGGR
jgi:hypothetical protein